MPQYVLFTVHIILYLRPAIRVLLYGLLSTGEPLQASSSSIQGARDHVPTEHPSSQGLQAAEHVRRRVRVKSDRGSDGVGHTGDFRGIKGRIFIL